MSTDSLTSDRPARQVPLPSPGVAAAVTLAVVLAGVTLSAWWLYHCEQRVLEEIDALPGISVDAEYKFVGPRFLEAYAEREWMKWLGRVRSLTVYDESGQHAALPYVYPSARPLLKQLPRLQSLRQCQSLAVLGLTVDGNRCFQGLVMCEQLRTVQIIECDLSQDALRGLDGHGGVTSIEMENCSVDGVVLELPKVETLLSVRAKLTQFEQIDVSNTPNLRRVEAKHCGFTDEGVKMLLNAPRLEVLMASNGTLTDAAIDDLLQLRSLRYLDLRHNGWLTRPAFERLAALPRLQIVNVYHTSADAELDELQKRLPQARSDRNQL